MSTATNTPPRTLPPDDDGSSVLHEMGHEMGHEIGHVVGTREAGLARLDRFLPRAARVYATGRNMDHGPDRREAVSGLSPYLRYRLITEREVVSAVLDRHGMGGAQKFIQEVLWRTYWKGWLEMRPSVWKRFIAERDAAREDGSSATLAAVADAEAGRTGIDGFDSWAHELTSTGYLHNHARMWFASIWIFTLRLPWTLGADFFLRHLRDADPASNTLSWRWVAGLQTAGKHYLATADNIAQCTEGRFSPRGLASGVDPLTEPPIPAARSIPLAQPLPPAESALLLVTGEDLHPESVMKGARVTGALIARGGDGVDPWPWGDRARGFLREATADAASRIEDTFDCVPQLVESIEAEPVIAAAHAARARRVVTPYAPVGPVADALARLTSSLATAGIELHRARRTWDDHAWPYATRGYFPFRKRIHAIVAAEGIRGDP